MDINYKEIAYNNEQEWHDIRRKHIGGSDVGIIMGLNPYNSDIQRLWRIKTGREQQEDISNNPAIVRGVKSEDLLIEHFKINNPNYSVSKLKKTLVSLKFPFMSANLDSVLINEKGEKGVLEIKTSYCPTFKHYTENWKEDIPIYYYLQVQHYLMVTGWKYAILYADLKLGFADNEHKFKQYYIVRNVEDIEILIQKEIWFNSLIVNDKEPPYTLKLA